MFAKKPDGPYDCPATGFKERCRKDACPEWIHVQGNNPQSGAHMDLFDCARRWQPVLLLELSKEVRQLAAAVESARNEARKDAVATAASLLEIANAAADPAVRRPGFLVPAGPHDYRAVEYKGE